METNILYIININKYLNVSRYELRCAGGECVGKRLCVCVLVCVCVCMCVCVCVCDCMHIVCVIKREQPTHRHVDIGVSVVEVNQEGLVPAVEGRHPLGHRSE